SGVPGVESEQVRAQGGDKREVYVCIVREPVVLIDYRGGEVALRVSNGNARSAIGPHVPLSANAVSLAYDAVDLDAPLLGTVGRSINTNATANYGNAGRCRLIYIGGGRIASTPTSRNHSRR